MSSPHSSPRRRLPGRLLFAWALALTVVVVDQATKQWALTNLDAPRPLIGDLIGLRLIFNSGAAFSLGESVTWLYTAVAALVTIGLAWWLPRVQDSRWRVTLALLLGGAAGNLIDRLAREPGVGRGHVIDFIDYGWFIGNVADIFIVGAALAIAALSLTGVPARPARPGADASNGPEVKDGERP